MLSSEELQTVLNRFQKYNEKQLITREKAMKLLREIALKDEREMLTWIELNTKEGEKLFLGDLMLRIVDLCPDATLSVSANQWLQTIKEEKPVPTLSELKMQNNADNRQNTGMKPLRRFSVDLMHGEGILALPRDVLCIIFSELTSVPQIGRLMLVCKKFFNAAQTLLDRVRAPRLTAIVREKRPFFGELKFAVQVDEYRFLVVFLDGKVFLVSFEGSQRKETILHESFKAQSHHWVGKDLYLRDGRTIAVFSNDIFKVLYDLEHTTSDQSTELLLGSYLCFLPHRVVHLPSGKVSTVNTRFPQKTVFVSCSSKSAIAICRNVELLELVIATERTVPLRDNYTSLLDGEFLAVRDLASLDVQDHQRIGWKNIQGVCEGSTVVGAGKSLETQFFTKLLVYSHDTKTLNCCTASGTVPVKLETDFVAIRNQWMVSLARFNACVPLLKPSMAFYSTSKFETQLPDFGGRIHMLDSKSVLAFDNVVLLVDDAVAPAFLKFFSNSDVKVMKASPIPLPSYLPRPNAE